MLLVIHKTACSHLPDFNGSFVAETDVSSYGRGGLFLQEFDGILCPIMCANQTMTPAECKCSVAEQECPVVVFALKKFGMHLQLGFCLVKNPKELRRMPRTVGILVSATQPLEWGQKRCISQNGGRIVSCTSTSRAG